MPATPTAPMCLTAALLLDPLAVNLHWKNGTRATSLRVQRAIGAGAFTTIATLSPSLNSYHDAGVLPGTTYRYQILAVNSHGTATSNSATITTPAGPVVAPLAILCPGNQTLPSPDGNPVVGTWPLATSTGGVAPATIAYTPALGSRFPVGVTTVQASVTDSAGHTAVCSFSLTVTAPPAPPPASLVLVVPTLSPVTSPDGQPVAVSYAASISGGTPPVALSYNPPSGSLFPVGTTAVVVSALDAGGQIASGSFDVVVVAVVPAPPPPLVVTCPADLVAVSPDGNPIPLSYAAVPSGGTPPITVIYAPLSGSLFAVGSRTVAVTAHDALGNMATCSFMVTVDFVAPPVPVPSAGADFVTLLWDPSAGAASYRVLYGTAPGVHPSIDDVGLVTTTTVYGLSPGTTYYFVVEAISGSGASAPSNEVSVTLP